MPSNITLMENRISHIEIEIDWNCLPTSLESGDIQIVMIVIAIQILSVMLIVTLAGTVIAVVVTMISSVEVIDPLILIFSTITVYYSTAIHWNLNCLGFPVITIYWGLH